MLFAFSTDMTNAHTISVDGVVEAIRPGCSANHVAKGTKRVRLHEDCTDCQLKDPGFFCNLPEKEIQSFAARTVPRSYSRGSTLFA